MDRREFLTGAVAAAGLAGCRLPVSSAPAGRFLFGACRGKPEEVRAMKNAGYDFWESHAGTVFDPSKDDAWWRGQKERLAAYALPLRACNGFLPGTFRLTGPNADPAPALDYAETVLRRADEIGVKAVVFGSGGARNVPGDFCGPKESRPDTEKGARQYAEFCAALAARTADLKTVQVVVEPLRPKESNIVNYVWQGLDVCRGIRSPRIAQLADVYHMMMGGERADVLASADAARFLRHVHVAEYDTRQFPGRDPRLTVRLRPYFRTLADLARAGGVPDALGISCECGWEGPEPFETKLKLALETMKGLFA